MPWLTATLPVCAVAYVADELQNENSLAGIDPVCICLEGRWYLVVLVPHLTLVHGRSVHA
jgi:hypothetical protein